MITVNIHQAKTNLSKLLAGIARGEAFVIAKAGKPVAKVIPFEQKDSAKLPRIGFLANQGFSVPDDFDTMFAEEIREMFEGKE